MSLITARVGDNVTLQCDGEHYDIIFWWRNGAMIQPGKQAFLRFRSTERGSQLHITNITKADNGTYRCEFVSILSAHQTVDLLVEGESHCCTRQLFNTFKFRFISLCSRCNPFANTVDTCFTYTDQQSSCCAFQFNSNSI